MFLSAPGFSLVKHQNHQIQMHFPYLLTSTEQRGWVVFLTASWYSLIATAPLGSI